MLRSKVAVEQIKKSNHLNDGLFVMPEAEQSLGIVAHVGAEALSQFSVGDKVYFGDKYQRIRMTGKDVMIMDPENIYARVIDEV